MTLPNSFLVSYSFIIACVGAILSLKLFSLSLGGSMLGYFLSLCVGSYVSWVRLAVYLVVAECMLLLGVPSTDSCPREFSNYLGH